MQINVGSDDDLPADNPTLRLKANLSPLSVLSDLLYLPPGNSSSRRPGTDTCAIVDPAALWSATVATWDSRKSKWGSIQIPDVKLARAAEIAQQVTPNSRQNLLVLSM